MAIQVRRGNEADFDPSKMLPGEWAVSLDTKYVRMCFSPGVCLRMATYDAFEADMAQIRSILAEARSVQEAVARIQTEINDTAVVVEDYSILSKSYAVGGTGTRENEDVDNARYYYEQAKHISQGGNGLIPLGTIAFENLPTEDVLTNGMYNISNDFTSDERFVDGGGILYGKGSNVYYTVNGLWDVLAASDVKGIKGENEDIYRQGNVTITKDNIGVGDYGEENISDIADGTVKGAIRQLADKSVLSPSDVVDNLLSTATDKPLSANQGRALDEKITTPSEDRTENLDVLDYFNNLQNHTIVTVKIATPINAGAVAHSWFTFYKTGNYGRIEQRPINSDVVYVNCMNNGNWWGWEEYVRKSDLLNRLNERYFAANTTHEITFSSFSTSALLFISVSNERSVLYVYSNGYLSPISTDSLIEVSLSSDYKKITIKNNTSSTGRLGVIQTGGTEITFAEIK